jgi:hypothetical protein
MSIWIGANAINECTIEPNTYSVIRIRAESLEPDLRWVAELSTANNILFQIAHSNQYQPTITSGRICEPV